MKLRSILENYIVAVVIVMLVLSCSQKNQNDEDIYSYAESRKNDLRLSTYITAHTIKSLLSSKEGRREAISIFKCNGITKAYIEVYRGGFVVDPELLEEVRDLFIRNGIDVVGGIATVPGKDFGIRQEGKLGWFNWQNNKTQDDLKDVMRMSAQIFDEFIIDDFLCTADTSEQSKLAKGNQSWSEYRRDLLTELSDEIFVKPAKQINPNIKLIIKYPQWYDRFHLFGYDLSRQPKLFDEVWVGTESRGQYTQRYGFVQPYEGFVNYRWISDIVKEKIGGAWFDHGDCDANDFIEQAFQSVLAGAKELVIFNYYNFVKGHEGHHLVRTKFHLLADLARYVEENPVIGVKAYKPVNSDAGGDLYLFDFIGSLGVSLLPVSEYPYESKAIFLPTQAAADKGIYEKIKSSVQSGATIILTSGFLANVQNGKEIAELAGIEYPISIEPFKANKVLIENTFVNMENGLDMAAVIQPFNADVILNGYIDSEPKPFLIKSNNADIFLLNTHTFNQEDFDRVGEVLLCPKPLGLLDIPTSWANILRDAFIQPYDIKIESPTRTAVQLLGTNGYVIHNYNKSDQEVVISSNKNLNNRFINGFTEEALENENGKLKLIMKPRSRIWIKLK